MNSSKLRVDNLLIFILSVLIVQLIPAVGFAGDPVPLVASPPIELSGPPGRFDFLTADAQAHRILSAHTGTGTLEVVDLKSGKPMKAISVGDAQGVAVDVRGHRYFLGNDKKQSVVTVDSNSFKIISEVKVDGPVDAITFDPKNELVFAAKDDGASLWVVDPKTAKVVGAVSVPGVPEVLEYDLKTDRIYLNIKDKDLIAKIDPNTRKVEVTWPTAPATSPHGLAVDTQRGRVFAAGRNGQLVSVDVLSGKVLSSVAIPEGVDQIAFDPETRMIYSACKGLIGVSMDSDKGLRSLGSVASHKGSHTLAIDPKSHDVWVAYSDEKHSYLQKFGVRP
ncbi:hypothetical protein BH10BDE1_BH10BDE1_23320 [soil metagenome]